VNVRSGLLVVALLVATSAFGLWWRSRQGRTVMIADQGPRLAATEIGAPLGGRVTFVQLSSTMCAPCRSTAAVLGALAGDGVVHVELDVAEHLDLVRRLDVLRTPTTLVLDPDGTVLARLNGALSSVQARQALDEIAPARCPDGLYTR
jgi:thiol-disulfide isomerase/thioredoxin